MAKMTFKSSKEYAIKLSRLSGKAGEVITKKAIYAGAKIVTDKIRSNLSALPEDKFRHLSDGEKFTGVPKSQKKDLLSSLGITPITADEEGNFNTKIGFDGYGSFPTDKYSSGVPNPLLARAIESGSSVREKTPFVEPAVKSTRKAVTTEMNQIIEVETKKIMK